MPGAMSAAVREFDDTTLISDGISGDLAAFGFGLA